jgi:hypothetical protein
LVAHGNVDRGSPSHLATLYATSHAPLWIR